VPPSPASVDHLGPRRAVGPGQAGPGERVLGTVAAVPNPRVPQEVEASPEDRPQPAATIMVVRDRPPGAPGAAGAAGAPTTPAIEVLMLRRNLRSEFMGGAFVFPGGRLDAGDDDAAIEGLCTGRAAAEASRLLGVARGGLAYWVAAIRECFEEAGILIARRAVSGSQQEPLSLADPVAARRLAARRQALNARRCTLADVCRAEGLELPVGDIHYFAHWVTPLGAPRRYDTRFFVVAAPPDQTALHDAGETIEDVWVTPQEALRRHRDGEIELVFPTVRNLQAIGMFDAVGDLVDTAAAQADRVATVVPRIVVDGDGVRILVPGDPGYDEAPVPEVSRSGDPEAMNRAIRALSRAANREPAEGTPGEPA
jgi:8-oxo-dGTP pyrophosphatase MutT (NUDIX family)